MESVIADACHGIGDGERANKLTISKCVLANSGDGVRQSQVAVEAVA